MEGLVSTGPTPSSFLISRSRLYILASYTTYIWSVQFLQIRTPKTIILSQSNIILLKGWCTWHKTCLQMMILGPQSRVMMVRQKFCAKKCRIHTFVCAKISPACAVLYLQLTWELLWLNRTAKDLPPPQVFRKYGKARLCKTSLRCQSFWTPAVP